MPGLLGFTMSRLSARQVIRRAPLIADGVHKIMRRLFPKKNDFGDASFDELVSELARLGVHEHGQFELLMKRHRRRLLEIDASPMDAWHVRYYSRELGEAVMRDHLRRNYWFAYPALARIAIELEYGEDVVEAAAL